MKIKILQLDTRWDNRKSGRCVGESSECSLKKHILSQALDEGRHSRGSGCRKKPLESINERNKKTEDNLFSGGKPEERDVDLHTK